MVVMGLWLETMVVPSFWKVHMRLLCP